MPNDIVFVFFLLAALLSAGLALHDGAMPRLHVAGRRR